MAQKDRILRRIDERPEGLITGGGQLIQSGQTVVATPAFPSAPPPENVEIGTQALLRTTYTPKVLVAVSWDNPVNLLPELYSIEAAEDSAFNTNLQRWSTTLTSGVIELKPDLDYWIRVQAIVRGVYSEYGYPDTYPSASVHTLDDTTPPNPVSAVSTNWNTGDLRFSWTNPSSDNFFQTRVRIYDTFGGTLYKEVYVVGNPGSVSQYIFTADENKRVTTNNPLTTVYYELLAYSIAGVPAASSVTGTVTKAKPTQPTGLTSTWASDDGTFDEGVTISWNSQSNIQDYIFTVDGNEKIVYTNFYVYPYTNNVSDHRPTLASGKPNIAYTVQARDQLGQVSPGASGTATNLAPSASNLTLTTAPGFSTLFAYVTPTKEIQDFHHYRWILASGGNEIQYVTSFTPEVSFPSLHGTYALAVQAVDMFGRSSTKVSASGLVLDGLTIEQLRAETQYTNSLGTNPTVLDQLKDNNLVKAVFTVPSGTTWQWTLAQRPLLERFRTITATFSGAATNMPRVYFGLSSDDSTYSWFSGPLVATGTTGQSTTLTAYASEALAQSNAVLVSSTNRLDLPSVTEARYVKMGHRGNIHHPAEFYPRRLVQSDDMEAENVDAINIRAGAVTAEKVNVINLQALSAQMGNLHMDGVIDIQSAGGIYQGTGSFASPTTGLKIYNTSGIGRLALYSGGILQVDTTTNGILTAGAGAVRLTASGMSLLAIKSDNETITSYPQYQISWLDRDVTTRKVAGITGDIALGTQTTHFLKLYSYSPNSSRDSVVKIYADSASHNGISAPTITITNLSDFSDRSITLEAVNDITLDGGNTRINTGGLIVGSIVGSLPSAGQIRTAGIIISEDNGIQSLGAGAGLIFADRSAGTNYIWYGNANVIRLWDGAQDVVQVTPNTAVFNLNDTLAEYRINGTKVVDARITGWGTPTGTLNRVALTNASTQTQFNQAIMAVITDLISHGLIGA